MSRPATSLCRSAWVGLAGGADRGRRAASVRAPACGATRATPSPRTTRRRASTPSHERPSLLACVAGSGTPSSSPRWRCGTGPAPPLPLQRGGARRRRQRLHVGRGMQAGGPARPVPLRHRLPLDAARDAGAQPVRPNLGDAYVADAPKPALEAMLEGDALAQKWSGVESNVSKRQIWAPDPASLEAVRAYPSVRGTPAAPPSRRQVRGRHPARHPAAAGAVAAVGSDNRARHQHTPRHRRRTHHTATDFRTPCPPTRCNRMGSCARSRRSETMWPEALAAIRAAVTCAADEEEKEQARRARAGEPASLCCLRVPSSCLWGDLRGNTCLLAAWSRAGGPGAQPLVNSRSTPRSRTALLKYPGAYAHPARQRLAAPGGAHPHVRVVRGGDPRRIQRVPQRGSLYFSDNERKETMCRRIHVRTIVTIDR